jgi:hypothetical protein
MTHCDKMTWDTQIHALIVWLPKEDIVEGCAHCHNDVLIVANNESYIYIFIFIVKCLWQQVLPAHVRVPNDPCICGVSSICGCW